MSPAQRRQLSLAPSGRMYVRRGNFHACTALKPNASRLPKR